MIVRAVGPTSVAKGPAIDRTNRTDETYKSYLSYWSRCTIVALSSNERQNNGGKTISGCDRFAPIVLPDRAARTENRGVGRLHRPQRIGRIGAARRSSTQKYRIRVSGRHRRDPAELPERSCSSAGRLLRSISRCVKARRYSGSDLVSSALQ